MKTVIATAQAHCQSLRIEPDITNRVLRTLPNQVLDQKVASLPDAMGIANALLRSEAVRSKSKQDEAGNKLRERNLARLDKGLDLAWAKHEFNAVKHVLKILPELQAIQKDNTLNDFEKTDEIRLKLFGCIAENERQL